MDVHNIWAVLIKIVGSCWGGKKKKKTQVALHGNHDERINITLFITRDICSYSPTNLVLDQPIDHRVLHGEEICSCTPSAPACSSVQRTPPDEDRRRRRRGRAAGSQAAVVDQRQVGDVARQLSCTRRRPFFLSSAAPGEVSNASAVGRAGRSAGSRAPRPRAFSVRDWGTRPAPTWTRRTLQSPSHKFQTKQTIVKLAKFIQIW